MYLSFQKLKVEIGSASLVVDEGNFSFDLLPLLCNIISYIGDHFEARCQLEFLANY